MDTQAAVLWETHTDWNVEDITLDQPKAGEVMVKLAASGLCHSDEHLVTGDMVMPPEIQELMGIEQLPIIGGHEGAGEVVEVGPGVTTLKPGDHVALSFIPACGRCPSCARGRQHLCDLGAFLLAGRQITDLTARHHMLDGRDLGIMCCVGTFSPYTVVSEATAVKIDDDIPLDKAALVGCGVTTGWGSAVNAAAVAPGETVVIVGIGGIGINAVQGAVMSGARFVVAVDPVAVQARAGPPVRRHPHRRHLEEAQELVGQITWGAMADKAIITTGVAEGAMVGQVMGLVAKGGRCVVTAVANVLSERGQPEPVRPRHAAQGAGGLHLRQRQPPPRHPPPPAPLHGREAQARRAGHQHLRAQGRQPGLPGHA